MRLSGISSVGNGLDTWSWIQVYSDFSNCIWSENWMNEPDLEYWEGGRASISAEIDKADNLTEKEKTYIKDCMIRFFDIQIKECIDKALDIK